MVLFAQVALDLLKDKNVEGSLDPRQVDIRAHVVASGVQRQQLLSMLIQLGQIGRE